MNSFLDHYCERSTPQLWDEPLNVMSNLAFFLVAFLIFKHLHATQNSKNKTRWDLWLLSGLILAIGIGSSIWHLFALSWTLWADRIPILLFISVFLISFLVRIFRLTLLSAFSLFSLFQIINIAIQLQYPPTTLNGSLFYLPTLVLLIVITIILWRKNHPEIKRYFQLASILFVTAIFFRSIDLLVCDTIPMGTHFVWHILVASTIYPLMLGLIGDSHHLTHHEK